MKTHENPMSGSRGIPRGRTDRETEMTKLIIPFRNFVKAPKKWYIKLNTKQTKTLQDTDSEREREREREKERMREMTETKLLIANIKYRGRLINEAFLELQDEREDA